jgi:hypothetical protein
MPASNIGGVHRAVGWGLIPTFGHCVMGVSQNARLAAWKVVFALLGAPPER